MPDSERQKLYQLPNLLTLARIILVPVLLGVFLLGGALGDILSVVVFVLAGITDYFDGYLARRLKMESQVGNAFDPIADKLLIITTLALLIHDGTLTGLHLAAAMFVIWREIFVSGLREYIARIDITIPIIRLAKYKTAIQMVALGCLLAAPTGAGYIPNLVMLGLGLFWISVALTLITGFEYLRRANDYIE